MRNVDVTTSKMRVVRGGVRSISKVTVKISRVIVRIMVSNSNSTWVTPHTFTSQFTPLLHPHSRTLALYPGSTVHNI